MENESKMYYKPQYKCGICGSVYDSIVDRAKCENACLKKQEDESKKVAEEKQLEEKKARMAEIKLIQNTLNEKIESYINDYGTIILDNFVDKIFGWWL